MTERQRSLAEHVQQFCVPNIVCSGHSKPHGPRGRQIAAGDGGPDAVAAGEIRRRRESVAVARPSEKSTANRLSCPSLSGHRNGGTDRECFGEA